MKLSWKGVHSIELDEFYSSPSFVFVGPLRGRILPGFTKIHGILWLFSWFCEFFGRIGVGMHRARESRSVLGLGACLCWSTLSFVWFTAWPNPPGKYSNPDVRYPTCSERKMNNETAETENRFDVIPIKRDFYGKVSPSVILHAIELVDLINVPFDTRTLIIRYNSLWPCSITLVHFPYTASSHWIFVSEWNVFIRWWWCARLHLS